MNAKEDQTFNLTLDNGLRSIITSVLVIISLILPTENSFGQYINPPYGGTESTGFGEVGTQLAGPINGILNPSTLLTYTPRFNVSLASGIYSNYYLFLPTAKDISINIPIIKQTLCWRGYYGIPRDNTLRNSLLHSYSRAYLGGKKFVGTSLAYRLPLNKLLTKWNYFDLRLGTDIAWYQGKLAIKNPYPDSNSYWVSRTTYTSGARLRFGSLLHIRYTSAYYWILATTLQGSTSHGFSKKRLDFLTWSAGFKYFFGDERAKSIQTGFEVENNRDQSVNKIGIGLKYNFTETENNSIQVGMFTTPKNAYNPLYQNKRLYWYSLGFTKTVKDWLFALSIADALNLKLSKLNPPFSDIAKIVTVSLSIPFSIYNVPQLNPEFNATPELIDFSAKKRRLLIGKQDTLDLYLQYLGEQNLTNPKIFFNIEPPTGILLKKQYIELDEIRNKDFIPLQIPIKAIPDTPSNTYLLTASLTYGNNDLVTKQLTIQTVEPLLDVEAKVSSQTQYWFWEIPGLYNLKLVIDNYGEVTSDSLRVILSDNLTTLGLVDQSVYAVTDIKPHTKKELYIEFRATEGDLPPRIPITIYFEESHGFNPLPIHADLAIVNKTMVIYSEKQKDPFLTNFKEIDKFYIVLSPEWPELKQLSEKTTINLTRNSNFPGKIVIGPVGELTQLLALQSTLSNYSDNYEIVALKGHRVIPIKRYFFMVEKNESTQRILDEIAILPSYSDLLISNKILIGPFQELKSILDLEPFIKEYFKFYQIVTRYPNQVDLPFSKGKSLTTIFRKP